MADARTESNALPPRDRVASFDVDAQRTFTPLCPEELPVPEGDRVAAALNRQSGFASLRLGSKDAHSPQAVWVTEDRERIGEAADVGEHADLLWPVHAVPGTDGFELLPELPRPWEYDYFVWKGVELDMHPYGACYHDLPETMSTGVIEFLKARGISHVLVGGLATDFCVKHTARQLAEAGFQVILNKAACRGIDPDAVAATYRELEDAGARIVDDLTEDLDTSRAED